MEKLELQKKAYKPPQKFIEQAPEAGLFDYQYQKYLDHLNAIHDAGYDQ